MALRMAEIMQEQRDVLVYFDIKGIEVCLKNAPDIQFAQMPSSKAQIAEAAGQEGDDHGLSRMPPGGRARRPEDLAEGIQIADKDKFFTFTKGRILTLDY